MDDNEKLEFTANDYLANLQALKDNTVSKDEYQRLVEDNKKLAQALANGEFISEPKPVKPALTEEEARAQLFDGKRKTDLQLFSEAIALREAVLSNGGRDPFLPTHKDYTPTMQDEADAERIASAIKESIEYADGDPALFRNEMMRRGCKSKG